MTLEDLGNLGDFVGGIAVIVTLLYLASQLRQNTKALETRSRQDIVDSYRTFNSQILHSAENADIWIRGLALYPDLPQPDRYRFSTLISEQMLHFQSTYALHESGALDEETYGAYLGWAAAVTTTPGGGAAWDEIKPVFARPAREALDAKRASGAVFDLTEIPSGRLDD